MAGGIQEALQSSIAPSSLRAYVSADSLFRRFTSDRSIDPTEPLSLVSFLAVRLANGASASSLGATVAAHRFFADSPSLSLVPMLIQAARRARPTVSHEAFSRAEIQRLVQWGIRPGAPRQDSRIALYGALSFSALLRISEACSLRWSDVSEEQCEQGLLLVVHIAKAKNDQEERGRDTRVCLESGSAGEELWTRVKALSPDPCNGFLFPSWNTLQPLSQASVRKEFSRACIASGIPVRSPHALRVGGASRSAALGVSLEAIQRRGRWRSQGGMASYVFDSLAGQGGALSL